ncbi:MAG: Uncharacterised protein [Marine Group II euryarchaeote MED-G33]|nr:MAG: Uncharacterised protein [Marine Group II euryarchaeote MED-G33]
MFHAFIWLAHALHRAIEWSDANLDGSNGTDCFGPTFALHIVVVYWSRSAIQITPHGA